MIGSPIAANNRKEHACRHGFLDRLADLDRVDPGHLKIPTSSTEIQRLTGRFNYHGTVCMIGMYRFPLLPIFSFERVGHDSKK